MSAIPPTLDSIATVRAKIGTEIRALETELATLDRRREQVAADLAIRIAVRNTVTPPMTTPQTPTLSIPRRAAR